MSRRRRRRLLYLVLYAGLLIFGLSIGVILYYLGRYFTSGIGVDGFTSQIVSIWFLGGLITLILGILGIYLANIMAETKRRPYTIVRRIHRANTAADSAPNVIKVHGTPRAGHGRAAVSDAEPRSCPGSRRITPRSSRRMVRRRKASTGTGSNRTKCVTDSFSVCWTEARTLPSSISAAVSATSCAFFAPQGTGAASSAMTSRQA